MAEKPYTNPYNSRRVRTFYWDNLTENDTGQAVAAPEEGDATFMVENDFGSGNVGLQGSLDPDLSAAVWVDLHDGFGNVIQLTADGVAPVAENMHWYRPKTPTGTSVDVNCWLTLRENV